MAADSTKTTDRVTWGVNYDLSARAQDGDGNDLLDWSWTAQVCFTKDRIGGPVVLNEAMTIADGAATYPVDTGDETIFDEAGVYWYDVRFTDGDGNDHWSGPIELTLEPRNTGGS